MLPSERLSALAKRQFTEGATSVLEPHEPVSHKERAYYFASIREAWGNLDADAVARYPDPEALRKWCLIKAGWRKDTIPVCDTNDRATVLAAFLRKLDSYAVVTVKGRIVRTHVARSQKIGRPEERPHDARGMETIKAGRAGYSFKSDWCDAQAVGKSGTAGGMKWAG